MIIKKTLPILFLGFYIPLTVFAAPEDFKGLIKIATDILSQVTLVVASLALLVFFWGVAESILASSRGDKTAAEDGRKRMFWGIIGLFAMVSIWGLVSVISNSFGINTGL